MIYNNTKLSKFFSTIVMLPSILFLLSAMFEHERTKLVVSDELRDLLLLSAPKNYWDNLQKTDQKPSSFNVILNDWMKDNVDSFLNNVKGVLGQIALRNLFVQKFKLSEEQARKATTKIFVHLALKLMWEKYLQDSWTFDYYGKDSHGNQSFENAYKFEDSERSAGWNVYQSDHWHDQNASQYNYDFLTDSNTNPLKKVLKSVPGVIDIKDENLWSLWPGQTDDFSNQLFLATAAGKFNDVNKKYNSKKNSAVSDLFTTIKNKNISQLNIFKRYISIRYAHSFFEIRNSVFQKILPFAYLLDNLFSIDAADNPSFERDVFAQKWQTFKQTWTSNYVYVWKLQANREKYNKAKDGLKDMLRELEQASLIKDNKKNDDFAKYFMDTSYDKINATTNPFSRLTNIDNFFHVPGFLGVYNSSIKNLPELTTHDSLIVRRPEGWLKNNAGEEFVEGSNINRYYVFPIYLIDVLSNNSIFERTIKIEDRLRRDWSEGNDNRNLYSSASSKYVRSLESNEKENLLIEMISSVTDGDEKINKAAEKLYFTMFIDKKNIVSTLLWDKLKEYYDN